MKWFILYFIGRRKSEGEDVDIYRKGVINLKGADLKGFNEPKGSDEKDTPYNRWNKYIRLNDLELPKANLTAADLKNTDLRDTNLSDAILEGTDLQGSSLAKAVLERGQFTRCYLKKCFSIRNELRGADLRGSDLEEATLKGTLLAGANLCRVQNLDKVKWINPSLFYTLIGCEYENVLKNWGKRFGAT